MAGAVDVGGVFHHRGPAPEMAEAVRCVGGRHGVVLERSLAPLWVAARFSSAQQVIGEREEAVALVVGTITNRDDVDRAIGARAKNTAECVAAAYARFGVDAFARMFGQYACMVWDAREKRLILARSAGVGGGPALFYVRDGQRTIFSTRLQHVPLPELGQGDLVTWARLGRWSAADRGPYREVEAVPPGHAVVLQANGRKQDKRIWTFSPLVVPRELAAHEARAELDELLERAIGRLEATTWLVGEPAMTTFFDRRVPAKKKKTHAHLITHDADAILRAARHVELPVPLSRLLTLAKLVRDPGADLVLDWGAREALGGTGPAMRAWIRSIARAIDSSPRPRTFAAVARLAWPIDRRLGTPRLHRDVLDVGLTVARRWSGQLPGLVGRRLLPLLGPESEPPVDAPDPVTSDPFVDWRFAETMDASMAAAHTAVVRLAKTNGRKAIAPFLAPEVIELLFSIPARYFVRDKRAMWLLDGGVPVEPPMAMVAPDALAPRLEDWLREATQAIGVGPDEGIDLFARDRWLGLGAWVFARLG